MKTRRKKKRKGRDLLAMSEHERIQLIKEIRAKIRKKMSEAKFWQSLLEVDSLTINGRIIFNDAK